jgi:diaminohydroxyphosphoribosylaminopyrimidine deaminase / 5-amino-6-(5-phosphoribosylamino)uracil reductase
LTADRLAPDATSDAASLDREFMAKALALAERGMFTTTPNPRVGCLIARDIEILGEGWHERAGEAHAEVRALRDAQSRGLDVRGATAYVTLEPCDHHGRTPPCTAALIDAGVSRVVAAMSDPNPLAGHGAQRLRDAGIAVSIGVLEDEARELNVGWIKRLREGRPWVRLKIAATLDGRTALDNGASQWITGEAARADGHRWRARACAILTGVGTVLQDDPQLNVRAVATSRQPIKVILDRRAEVPPTARLFASGETIVVTSGARRPDWPSSASTLSLPDAQGRIDLVAMLRALADRGTNELHVEAGAKLNGAMLGAGLVDEIVLYMAPALFGDPARGMFELASPLQRLADRIELDIRSVDRVGGDWRIVARPLSKH